MRRIDSVLIVKDRVAQQTFRQIIEPIFEKDFSDNSFGFCQNRCCHDAIRRLEHAMHPFLWLRATPGGF